MFLVPSKKYKLTSFLGIIITFSILVVNSVSIGEKVFGFPIFNNRPISNKNNHPFWTYFTNGRSSEENEGIHSKSLWNPSRFFGGFAQPKVPSKLSQLYQSFKKSRLKSISEIIGPEPKTKEASKALSAVKFCSHCIVDTGVHEGATLLVEKLFEAFDRRRNGIADSRSSNRRQLFRSTSVDIGKASSNCILNKAVSKGVESWWDSFKPQTDK